MAAVIHHQFTVQEYGRMIETGIIDENASVELIRGEIVKKMPIGRRHAAVVKRLNQWLVERLAGRAIVSVQDPIVLADSEPEPDLALLEFREDFYESSKPTGNDVRLVIEVSDTALDYDREIKLPMYAQANIAEMWIVNLIDLRVETYRGPQADGSYSDSNVFERDELLDILSFPELELPIADIL
ncbi:MAG: Uma2 family endonuclease [Aureliella sp.]